MPICKGSILDMTGAWCPLSIQNMNKVEQVSH